MFLLRRANPSAYVGLWQSRMSAPHIVREAGDLSLPILIDMQSGSLQHLVDQWTHQAAVHALVHHSGIVMLQIKRYGFEPDSGPTKNLTPLHLQPGEVIVLPQFASQEGLELQLLRFRVGYVIYHLGHTTDTGHYQVALCEKRGHAATAPWQFAICNDGCVPRRAAPSDLCNIAANCYLIGLIRVDPDDP